MVLVLRSVVVLKVVVVGETEGTEGDGTGRVDAAAAAEWAQRQPIGKVGGQTRTEHFTVLDVIGHVCGDVLKVKHLVALLVGSGASTL